MRRHLRQHPATATLRKRFNTPIYYQLRVSEITKPLEAALALPTLTMHPAVASTDAVDAAGTPTPEPPSTPLSPPRPPCDLSTAAGAALAAAITRSLSPEIFLPPLSSRLLRLCLQCLSYFNTWLTSLIPRAFTEGSGETAEPAAPPSTPPAAAALPPTSAVRGTSEVPGNATPTAAARWAEAGSPLVEPAAACALHLDLLVLIRWLEEELAPALPRLLRILPPPSADGASTSTDGSLLLEGLAHECACALVEGIDALRRSNARLAAIMIEMQVGGSRRCP